jgi:hypothetical protein
LGAYGSAANATIFLSIVSARFRGNLRNDLSADLLYSIFHTRP